MLFTVELEDDDEDDEPVEDEDEDDEPVEELEVGLITTGMTAEAIVKAVHSPLM